MVAVTPVRSDRLGLAIVRRGRELARRAVKMTSLPVLHGTRFEITFPGASTTADATLPPTAELGVVQTSTTTGRTIGRRRSRS